MDLQGGDAQGDEHRGRRDEAVDPVGPAPPAGERPRQVADDEPGQERAEDHHGRHLLDEGQAQEHADRHPPGAGVGLVQPLPERQGRGRPEEEPGHVGRRDVAVAVDAGHEQERARHHPADPGAVPPRQEPEPDRDRQRVLEDRGQPSRRDVLHPAAEEGVRQQVRLAGQGRVEVPPEATVGPVIEQGVRLEQRRHVGPGPRLGEPLPPLGGHLLAVAVRRLVPGQAEVAGRRHRGRQRHGQHDPAGQPPPTSGQASLDRRLVTAAAACFEGRGGCDFALESPVGALWPGARWRAPGHPGRKTWEDDRVRML